MCKEMIALIQLKKYRTLKNNYYYDDENNMNMFNAEDIQKKVEQQLKKEDTAMK